ncbi:hypothetical protein LTS18_007877 [Coniosporium uncinatum]|uniref:Uncharacterized protein n=1 Tax=Coniosporium uncinatum TaxID=93489 RepID=A0ACC3DZ99_9PEZI|nr:hypothetical protein LTS18_007877 [Coniosporium uncinatum]
MNRTQDNTKTPKEDGDDYRRLTRALNNRMHRWKKRNGGFLRHAYKARKDDQGIIAIPTAQRVTIEKYSAQMLLHGPVYADIDISTDSFTQLPWCSPNGHMNRDSYPVLSVRYHLPTPRLPSPHVQGLLRRMNIPVPDLHWYQQVIASQPGIDRQAAVRYFIACRGVRPPSQITAQPSSASAGSAMSLIPRNPVTPLSSTSTDHLLAMQHAPAFQVAHQAFLAGSESRLPPHRAAPPATAHDAQALRPRQSIEPSDVQNKNCCDTQVGENGAEEESDSDVYDSDVDDEGPVDIGSFA